MKNKLFGFLFWGFIGLLIVYLTASVIPSLFSGDGITVHIVESVPFDQSVTVSGIALRNESVVVTQTVPNSIDYKVLNGDRVSKGDVLASFSNVTISAKDRFSMDLIERQIDLLSACLASTTQYDLKTLDARTKESIRSYLDAVETGDLSASLVAADQVSANFIKRDMKASSDKEYYRNVLSNCETAKNQILSGEGVIQTSVTADTAGFFTTQFDGYEYLNSADHLSPTPEDVSQLLALSPSDKPQNYIGKLQHFSYWTYVCTVSEVDSERYTEGSVWSMRFPTVDGAPHLVSMTLRSVSAPKDGRVALCFESSAFNNAVYGLRITDAELILRSYSAFRVHKDSLRVFEGETGVYVLSGAKLVFKPVSVLSQTTGSDYVTVIPNTDQTSRTLSINDAIVIGGKNNYDGKVVNIH